jgi:hypothetical protein
MIITPEILAVTTTTGLCLPQTVVGPQKTVVVGMLPIPLQWAAGVPWLCLHVTDIAGVIRSSGVITSTKGAGSPATVTSTQPFFTPNDVNSVITWNSGVQSYITAYTSPTQVTVTNISGLSNPATGSVTDFFSVQPSTPTLINSALGAVVCGVISNNIIGLPMPGGVPDSFITTSSVGVTTLSAYQRRRYFGPDSIAVTLTNNTTNMVIGGVVTAAFRFASSL